MNIEAIFKYLQPIINVCAGFIKTDGYMLYLPSGTLILSDDNEMYCCIINDLLPSDYQNGIVAKINTFMSLKNPNDQSIDNLYFTGWNIKYNSLLDYYLKYNNIDNKVQCIYDQANCETISEFSNLVAKSNIQNINIYFDSILYRLPISKSITNLTKGDQIRLQIYNYILQPKNPQIKTVKYSLFKKKFGLMVNIFTNILIV